MNRLRSQSKYKQLFTVVISLLTVAALCACGAEPATPEEIPIGQTAVLTPEATPEQQKTKEYDNVFRISEVMVKNSSTLYVERVGFPDWVELENISGADAELTGWKIGNGRDTTEIVSTENGIIPAGGRALIIMSAPDRNAFSGCADLSLKPGCTVSLVAPDGTITGIVPCFSEKADVSLLPTEEGAVTECAYPTPGQENTAEAYDWLAAAHCSAGPLIINEAVCGNLNTARCNTGFEDWVELKNISDTPVNLSGYYLSNDDGNLTKSALPDKVLQPGACILVYCSGDIANNAASYIHADFKISSEGEALLLSDGIRVTDWLCCHDVPVGGSIGRAPDGTGVRVFTVPTPGTENGEGFLRMSSTPVSGAPDGIYENCTEVTVTLSAAGTIHYTTDGTAPTEASAVYSSPFSVSEVAIVRATAQEPGCAPSRELVLSYFVNKGHSLPVLSLVLDRDAFNGLYWKAVKDKYVPANLALYGDDGAFNEACGFCMKGWTSLNLPKKSMGVKFSGKYGGSTVETDIFDSGVSNYSALSLRAGQDYTATIVRNELNQELCKEFSDSVPTQNSKYCVLYINGEYWGIYCLKDDINRDWYANLRGVSKDDVVKNRAPAGQQTEINKEVLSWVYSADMTDDENYRRFTEIFDEDALIDWIIMEGFSGNTDIGGNLKYFRTEGGKWQIAFYDLDWAFLQPDNAFTTLLYSQKKTQVFVNIVGPLLKNDAFKEKLWRRAAEAFSGTLSDEHVTEVYDALIAEIMPEVQADRERWGMNMRTFQTRVDNLRTALADSGYAEKCLSTLLRLTKAPDELQEELMAMLN